MTEQEIAKLSGEDFRAYEQRIHLQRWVEFHKLPKDMYWPVFAPISSKRKGDIWEDMYRAACPDLGERLDRWHDATLTENFVKKAKIRGRRVEIKYTVITSGDSNKEIEERGYALELGERAKIITSKTDGSLDKYGTGGAFQQVHPENADYGLFSAVHGNGAIHYWVPYHLISRTAGAKQAEPGKILLSSQHDGGTVEGQINRTARLHECFFLDYTVGTPFITDLSKYDLSKFEKVVF